MKTAMTLLGVTLAGLVLATSAAASVTLTDLNSTATFDLASVAGLRSWTVDGREHLYQQWFWYRLGSSSPEFSIDTLAVGTPVLADSNGDGDDDALFVSYTGAAFRIDLTFILSGSQPTSGISNFIETIRVVNTGTTSLDFHLFEYVDLDLSRGQDTIEIVGGNTAIQTAGTTYVAESVVTSRPAYVQADLAANLMALLCDGQPSNLNNAVGPVTGDAAWAFQWDRVIGPGKTFIVSKNKHVVPEPATLCLLGLGLAVTVVIRRHGR